MPRSVDNLGFETDSLNLFAYCHNRPLNVNEIKTATTSSTYNYTNSTDLDISQALLIGAGAIGNVLDIAGTALDFVQVLKNTKIFNSFTGILTGISAGISFISSFDENVNVFLSSTIAGADILSAWIGSKAGIFIGGLIGGLAGAILGTLISILLTEFIDYILDWLISELLF